MAHISIPAVVIDSGLSAAFIALRLTKFKLATVTAVLGRIAGDRQISQRRRAFTSDDIRRDVVELIIGHRKRTARLLHIPFCSASHILYRAGHPRQLAFIYRNVADPLHVHTVCVRLVAPADRQLTIVK